MVCILVIAIPLNFSFPLTKYNIPVDQIYVINLDKSKERLNAISKSLNDQNLSFIRFPAVLGTDLKIKDEEGREFLGKDLKSGKVNFRLGEKYKIYCPNITINYEYNTSLARGHGGPLTAGEFGLYCSHFEVMLDVIKHRYKSVVVLEDDAVIPGNFSDELKVIEQNMPNHKKYDIIFLGYNVSSTKWLHQKLKFKKIILNDALDKITAYKMNAGSTHALLFGCSGAKKMLSAIKPHAGIDLDLFTAVNAGIISPFRAKRLNIQQGSFKSEIEDMGRKL